jgi:hypothetical protein
MSINAGSPLSMQPLVHMAKGRKHIFGCDVTDSAVSAGKIAREWPNPVFGIYPDTIVHMLANAYRPRLSVDINCNGPLELFLAAFEFNQ